MDAITGDNELELELQFEPDNDAEEELAEEEAPGEHVDSALITDVKIKQCRLLAIIQCVEYGTVSPSPGKTVPGMLLCIGFTFHPFQTRVKKAVVEILLNKATIAVLQPDRLDDDETAETVHKKLRGKFKIGYAPAGVEGTIGVERESERENRSERRIRGSGLRTSRVVWTLKENTQNKNGIPPRVCDCPDRAVPERRRYQQRP